MCASKASKNLFKFISTRFDQSGSLFCLICLSSVHLHGYFFVFDLVTSQPLNYRQYTLSYEKLLNLALEVKLVFRVGNLAYQKVAARLFTRGKKIPKMA